MEVLRNVPKEDIRRADKAMEEAVPRGADEIVGRVATELGFEVIPFSADWPKYGRAAGPIRNQKMLESLLRQYPEEPKLVLAFHRDLSRSKGTADMVKCARSAGVKVRIIS